MKHEGQPEMQRWLASLDQGRRRLQANGFVNPEPRITEEIVWKAMRTSNPKRAAGEDQIAPEVWKVLANELFPHLCVLFNAKLEGRPIP
eukprot:6307145-Alexandrium_andersonii.AAC.1